MKKELKASDVMLETAKESKLVEMAEITKCAHELKVIKGAVSDSEERYDGIIQEKLKETMKEEKDNESRKTNMVVFGLEKSYSDITTERKLHDRKAMEEIADVLQCSLKISNVIRMGKKIPKSTRGTPDIENKPRALMIILENEQSKKELLDKEKSLRDTQFNKIFITQDLTPKREGSTEGVNNREESTSGRRRRYCDHERKVCKPKGKEVEVGRHNSGLHG